MTDSSNDGDNELVLDWEDAVESFRLDEGSARAESEPFPQRATTTPAPASEPEPEPSPRSSEPDQERPTLPPHGSAPASDSQPPLSLEMLDAFDARISVRPPSPPSSWPEQSTSTSPPPTAASAMLNRTLAGLAPVSQRPSAQGGGGLFVQQRATLRPEASGSGGSASATAPAEPQVVRPSTPDQARPRMYQPPTPQEMAAFELEQEEDDSDATQVAAVPRELLEALLAGGTVGSASSNRITERPPPAASGADSEPPSTEIVDGPDEDTELTEIELLVARHNDDLDTFKSMRPQLRLSEAPRGLPPAPPQIAARLSLPAQARTSRVPTAPPPAGVLSDLDELLPPLAAPSGKPLATGPAARPDHGAKAAQRMVAAKQPKAGYGPLASLDDTGKRARLSLLEALARQKTGRAQATLLVSAAELSEELHEPDLAKEAYLRAHAAAPKLLSPIGALARLAFERRDFDDHLSWLSRAAEAAESARTRAAALAASARVHWLVQRDLPAALRAATEAARLCPDDVAHLLLEVRIELATRPERSDTALVKLAKEVRDDALGAALWSFAGRVQEARNEADAARASYQAAVERCPTAGDAQLSLARLAREQRADAAAAEALIDALPALGAGLLGDVVRRHAAVLLATDSNRLAQALGLLETSSDGASLRTAFALASLVGDQGAQLRTAAAWSHHSEGHDRALSLVTRAELSVRAGDSITAVDALEEALSIDRSLTLAKVLWESLVRESGDVQGYLKRSLGKHHDGSLRGAAKLAFEREVASAEVELLAQSDGERGAVAARTLRKDAQAEAGDVGAIALELERENEAAPTPAGLLAQADFVRRQHGNDAALSILRRAAELFPDEISVTRALARSALQPEEVVRALQLELATARGARAAFLSVLIGQLSTEPAARLAAFERAYELHPQYGPAVFALHSEARRQNELERLASLHTRESARAKDPFEAVSHLLRAALVRAHDDGDAAAAQLSRALDLAPSDPVLRELVIRLGDAVPASLRAEAMQRIAERASPPFERPAALAAAGAFEDAGQAERALGLYESVLRSHPEDPISELGRERVARAAGKARELLEAKRRAIHEATTDAGRIRALEDLLQADQDSPPAETLDRARALLVLSPTHPLALRCTERHAMERSDNEALFDAELRLLNASMGPKDKLSRLRMLSLLTSLKRTERARADDLDKVVVAAAPSTWGGTWLARQLMGAGVALADPEIVHAAIDLFAAETREPVEIASLSVRRARLGLAEPPPDCEAKLKSSLDAYPEHPTGTETLAELALARGERRAAAALFAQAAEQALYKPRTARLWAQAGKLFEDLRELDQARQAYISAVEADVTFEDVESRLHALFSAQADVSGLIKLSHARLAAGVPAELALKLRAQLAQLYEQRGDPKQAISMLREALDQTPENLSTLRELARLLGHEKDHRERAQMLLRIARISREPVELRDVFMQLGEIYDRALPDPKRAEAAYQRALKLGPRHVPALERLAALYTREGQQEQAEACLQRLIQLADSDGKRFEASLELSRARETRSDLRGAEEVLEALRRDAPIEPSVLRAVAEFYRRQGALSALAMHLNRATSDLRACVEHEPSHATAWLTLVETLEEKHRPDAARVVASAALACGQTHERLRKLVDASGEVPGVAGAAFSELLDDLVFRDDMPPGTRIVFRHGAEALNKAAPFELRAVAGERLDRRHPLRAVAQEAARWAGLTDIDVFVTSQLPLAFVPVNDAPIQLLVGTTLLETLSRPEQLFLTARAIKIARAQMSITSRVRPDEMGLLIHGLIRSQVPGYAPAGIDPQAVEEMSRRVVKQLSRRALPELLPHLMELMGAPNFDPERVYAVASGAGNRAGLLATGSLGAALSALTKLAGLRVAGRVDQELLENVEEARDLLSFAVSEAHFEARLRAGVDLR